MKGYGHASSVEDVLQDTWLEAYVHQDQFKGNSKLSSWHIRIAIDTALAFLRANKQQFISFDDFDKDFAGPGKNP